MAVDQAAELKSRRPVGRPRTIDSARGSLSQVLNLIRTGAATTRQDLERQSELGRAVVADRLTTLSRLGLIEEGDLGVAKGGRAPRHFQLRAGAALILLAVLDQTSLAVGLSDLGGTLLVEHHEAVDLAVGPRSILERLATLFNWLMEDQSQRPVWGIGLAVPGPVGSSTETVFSAPAIHALQTWENFPLVEELTIRFGAPVWVRSGIQMMAIGEQSTGAGKHLTDVLFVKLGRSITAGIISNGQLHTGAQGAAGMIGQSDAGGQPLEIVAGADAITREAQAASQDGRSPYLANIHQRGVEIGTDDVGHGAQLGDAVCVELLARAGRLIGEALAPLANLINPSAIVLSGTLAQTGDILLAAVREAVYRQSHPLVTRDLKIVKSQMGGSAGLVGAGQVVAEALFAPPLLTHWIALGSPRQHPQFIAFLEQAHRTVAAPPPRPEPPKLKRPK
jgi:predicted NBD/HSP70 family sugar kinase